MYRTIAASFWTDPKVKELPADGKLLLLYLITNPHTHVSGIYILDRMIMARETALTPRRLDTLCYTLSNLRFCTFDRARDIVWVRKMMSYQGKGEKNLRSAAAHVYEDLHNSILCNEFLEMYPAVKPFMKGEIVPEIDTVSDRVSTTRTPDSRFPIPIPDTRLPIPEQDSEKNTLPKTYGEFGSVVLSEVQHEKLLLKLNGRLDAYIDRLDRYSQTDPKAFRKYKNHYAVILNWFDRDVAEGKVKPTVTALKPSERFTKEELDRETEIQFGWKHRKTQ